MPPGSPAYNAYFSNPANRHPPWGSGPPSPYSASPRHRPALPPTHTRENRLVPHHDTPRPARTPPQGGISIYNRGRLSIWVSNHSFPNHPKPSHQSKPSTTPKGRPSHHKKHPTTPKQRPSHPEKHSTPRTPQVTLSAKLEDGVLRLRCRLGQPKGRPSHPEKHYPTPRQRSSHPANGSKEVVPRKGHNGKGHEAARPKRLVCDFCRTATPAVLDGGRWLGDDCEDSFRRGRRAGR